MSRNFPETHLLQPRARIHPGPGGASLPALAPCAELALCAELASWRRGRRRERPSDHRTMRGSTTVPVALGIVPTPPGWS